MQPYHIPRLPQLPTPPCCSLQTKEKALPVYPDYSIAKSSGDSVASGDDSGQWEVEGELILAAHVERIAMKEAGMWDDVNDIEEELDPFELLHGVCGKDKST